MSSEQSTIKDQLLRAQEQMQHLSNPTMILPVFLKLNVAILSPTPSSKDKHSFLAASSKPKSPSLKEIISLIQDGLNGDLNKYVQEMISEAEFSIQIQPQNPKDSNSRQEIQLKLTTAATAIDKYAGLLSVILDRPDIKQSSTINTELQKGMNNINAATKRIKRLEVLQSLPLLDSQCKTHIDDHYQPGCWSICFESLRQAPRASAQYHQVKYWLEDLVQQPLTLEELMGAIYYLRSQIQVIRNPLEQNALRDNLDRLIKRHGFPVFTDDSVSEYLKAFENRAPIVQLEMPAHFEIRRTIGMISLV